MKAQRFIVFLIPLTLLLGTAGRPSAAAIPDPSWPFYDAEFTLRVIKWYGMEMETEISWLHLHQDSAEEVGLSITCYTSEDQWSEGAHEPPDGVLFRYTVLGLPVSGWLPWSNRNYTLRINNPTLQHVHDGVLDISLEVQSAQSAVRLQYKPWPAFLHLKRGQAISDLVPVMYTDHPGTNPWSPCVIRIQRSERLVPPGELHAGLPASPSVRPWHTVPYETDLYMEVLTPASQLYQELQMWWEDVPNSPGLYFVRGMAPMQGEDPRGLNLSRLPVADGPRGVGWMSAYIQGVVDPAGRLVFAEIPGRVGWLLPDGEVVTLAGWTLAPGKLPGWVRKPLSAVRGNQVLLGEGAAFREPIVDGYGGFGKPMDVALDPQDPTVLYVADMARNCVWRLRLMGMAARARDLTARPTSVQVELLAGAADGSSGYADGPGTAALFHSPFSLVCARGALFVSDSANHAIRRISLPDGAVTTQWGEGPSFLTDTLPGRVSDVFDREQLRSTCHVAVSGAEAATGVRPDIYWPGVLRARSDGSLVLLEHGFGQVRRLDPDTHVASVLADVDQKFGEWDHGWAWLDVDTAGATGPTDGLWWCKVVGGSVIGDDNTNYHYNEVFAYVPPEGGGSRLVFTGRGGGANPSNFGERIGVTPPHYPWLVAVDPRGAVYMAGVGGHGIVRLRQIEKGDPTSTESWDWYRGSNWYLTGAQTGPGVHSMDFRYGPGGHNMLGLRSGDAWQTHGMSDSQLLRFYGVDPTLLQGNAEQQTTDEDMRRIMLSYLSVLSGPERDGVAALPPDVTPPPAPGAPAATDLGPGGVVLKWLLVNDNVAVQAYELQVALDPGFTRLVQGFNGVKVGHTEVVLLEGLAGGAYWARLRAVDLAGNTSPWGAPAQFQAAGGSGAGGANVIVPPDAPSPSPQQSGGGASTAGGGGSVGGSGGSSSTSSGSPPKRKHRRGARPPVTKPADHNKDDDKNA